MIKRPMKGEQLEDLSKVRFPVYGAPKIDGFRCVLGSKPMTSRLGLFPNRHFNQEASGLLKDDAPLDGEIVVGSRKGKGVLGRTSSGLTSEAGEPDWTLWVFDTPNAHGFHDRLQVARFMVQLLDNPRIRFLKHTLIEDLPSLERYLENKLEQGYEGIMLRDPKGPYKEGKATLKQGWLMKVKPFVDFEARITGYFEEEKNTNEATREVTGKLKRSSAKAGKVGKGTLGGFIGETIPDGTPVRVGGGFTAAQRKAYWLIKDELVAAGEVMTCTKQKMGEKDAPRHPNFKSLRPKWDLAV
jgi:ATP-dependent DNA ligase